MAIQIQLRQGTTTEHNTFTGANGEVTVDTTNKTLRVHDGYTIGGTRLATLTGGEVPAAQLPAATTSTQGAVILNNTLTSTSTTQALTAAQGKVLKDSLDTVVSSPLGVGQTWQDGYVVLPNGLMFQWGRHDLPNNGGESGITITFPTPFPNACFNAQATRITASASGDNSDGGISVYSYDTTTLEVHLSTFYGGAYGSLRGFTWFAIGR